MKKGFTLIELLVVVAIISVLSSIVMAGMHDARGKARDIKRMSDLRAIETALETYHLDNGQYPSLVLVLVHLMQIKVVLIAGTHLVEIEKIGFLD